MGRQQQSASNAPARRDAQDIKGILTKPATLAAIRRALPKHVDERKVISAALTAASLNPTLQRCEPTSVIRSVVMASQLGLEPGGGPLGSAYLVPYYSTKRKVYECQLIPGYRGLIDLARRSGAVRNVEARVVYDCDTFEHEFGTETKVRHVPRLDRPDDAEPIAFYAVVHMVDGSCQVEVMSIAEIRRIAAMSKSRDRHGNAFGPWVDHFDEMGRKTVVRRALKYAPLSTELATALEAEARAERDEPQGVGILDLAPEDLEDTASQADELARQLEASGSASDDGDLVGVGADREPGEEG